MDLKKIRELLEIVAESGVDEIEIEEDDFKLTIRKSAPTITMQQGPQPVPYAMPSYAPPAGSSQVAPPAPPQQSTNASTPAATAPSAEPAAETEAAPPEPAGAENETPVTAPIVGTFYRRPSPDDDPYVDVGDHVEPGDVLCIIEAMKLMNEIESEVAGTIRKVLAEDAQPVEYEQPLFVIEEG